MHPAYCVLMARVRDFSLLLSTIAQIIELLDPYKSRITILMVLL